MVKNRPFASQGQALKIARGPRKQAEVAALIGVSIGRYQNWEYGKNRPSPPIWEKIEKHLGLDASRLYAGVSSADRVNNLVLDPDVVMALVMAATRNLEALRVLCAPHISNRRLEQNGIKEPQAKKKTTA